MVLDIPERKLYNLKSLKKHLVSLNIAENEYFSLAYENKDYLSYIMVNYLNIND